MTEEELNRLEEMSLDVGRCIGMAHNTILSLIRLARVGLAVQPRPIAEAPKDGAIIYGLEPYKWVAYKKGSAPYQIKRGGRWQKFNGFGWENAEPPDAFVSALPKPGV